MASPLLGQFLVAINGFVKAENASQLTSYIALEPPFNQQYYDMIQELRTHFAKGKEQELEERCTQYLTAAVEWTNFTRFMLQYFVYLRDMNADQSAYLSTYEQLLELQTKANSALGQGALGTLLLNTVITNAKLLCKLAIGLDKQPQLIAHLRSGAPQGDEGQRETLPERAANTVRSAFVICLNDRSDMLDGRPQGKQLGIYVLANLCLKILFQCRKEQNAIQLFEQISNGAPVLAVYPKHQRVTYLYYLGQFLFQTNHFYRAQLVLQAAYDESPATPQSTNNRRLILVKLIAANLIMGRFPSNDILSTPEAAGFREHFLPLCKIIKHGNLSAFEEYFAYDGPHVAWLTRFSICYQLKDRCEVLVWRSLTRRVFQICGSRPAPGARVAAQLDLRDAVGVFAALQPPADTYIDPDLEGYEEELSTDYQQYDLIAMESKLSSLIDQGFVSGYLSHQRQRLAILGAQKADGDHVKAGFPNVWSVISRRSDDEVPGWRKTSAKTAASNPFAAGPGMVFNFSNLRPVGAVG